MLQIFLRKLVLANQRSEQWFSQVEKMIRPIRIANEKSFTQRVCLAKKVKNISEIEWNSFVCFTVDKENGREPAKQQRKRKNRTRRKLLFCFQSELLCLLFKLKLKLKPAILLKFSHFQLRIENKQLSLLIVLGLPHMLNVIYVFNKRFYYKS